MGTTKPIETPDQPQPPKPPLERIRERLQTVAKILLGWVFGSTDESENRVLSGESIGYNRKPDTPAPTNIEPAPTPEPTLNVTINREELVKERLHNRTPLEEVIPEALGTCTKEDCGCSHTHASVLPSKEKYTPDFEALKEVIPPEETKEEVVESTKPDGRLGTPRKNRKRSNKR